jgi:hypothetical protein
MFLRFVTLELCKKYLLFDHLKRKLHLFLRQLRLPVIRLRPLRLLHQYLLRQ